MNIETDFFYSGPRLMGIVNVTPDSFSDGGRFINADKAVAHGLKLIEEGADILDIGGESTRPGALPLSIDEELDRVIPVIAELHKTGIPISIDTRHARTMSDAISAGACMINDVTALSGDPDSVSVAASLKVPVCLMHMQGTPQTMQNKPIYKDVTAEVFAFLKKRIEVCETGGIDRRYIIADPGIGFGKAVEHNLELIHNVSELKKLDVSLLVGLSRKSFISHICKDEQTSADPLQRLPGSIAAALWCLQQGVQIFRVHDVAQTRQAFTVYEAIRSMA